MVNTDMQTIQTFIKEFLPTKKTMVKIMLEKFIASNETRYLILTSAGTIIGRLQHDANTTMPDSLLPLTDVCVRTNDGQTLNSSHLFLFSDEITALQTLDETTFQEMTSHLQKKK